MGIHHSLVRKGEREWTKSGNAKVRECRVGKVVRRVSVVEGEIERGRGCIKLLVEMMDTLQRS